MLAKTPAKKIHNTPNNVHTYNSIFIILENLIRIN